MQRMTLFGLPVIGSGCQLEKKGKAGEVFQIPIRYLLEKGPKSVIICHLQWLTFGWFFNDLC